MTETEMYWLIVLDEAIQFARWNGRRVRVYGVKQFGRWDYAFQDLDEKIPVRRA